MSEGRGRVLFAALATVTLAAAVIVFAVSGSADDEGLDDPCLAEWNDDAIARSDGVHAYQVHGYRATLLARVDPDGDLIPDAGGGPPTERERCAVVFASSQVDAEPDFGVRVHDRGRWAGLALVDKVPLDRIAALQRDATETANVTLLPDGRLTD